MLYWCPFPPLLVRYVAAAAKRMLGEAELVAEYALRLRRDMMKEEISQLTKVNKHW